MGKEYVFPCVVKVKDARALNPCQAYRPILLAGDREHL